MKEAVYDGAGSGAPGERISARRQSCADRIRTRRQDGSRMNTGDILIRKAGPGDAELIASFGAQTFQTAFGDQNTPEDMQAYLALNFSIPRVLSQLNDPRAAFLLGFADERLVGYSMLSSAEVAEGVSGEDPIELVRIYVDSQQIGSGFGSKLLEASIRSAGEKGHDIIWLGVWERNLGAIKFYRRWGFAEVGWKQFQLGNDLQRDLIFQRSTRLAP